MLEVQGLTKYYGLKRAIYDISFEIGSGQIAGFLGLNGAGKTTVLKILSGFLLPTSGTVKIDGTDLVSSPDALRACIGFLPEEPPLYPEMTVRGFLRYLAQLRGVATRDLKRQVERVTESTGLTEVIDQSIGSLSLGYRRRVGIAQSIIHDPALVLLDEPISGLDPIQIVEMRSLIRDLAGDHTILISSHILTEVEETCDTLLVLKEGELVARGSEADLRERFAAALSVRVAIQGAAEEVRSLVGGLDVVASIESLRHNDKECVLDLTLQRDEPEALASAVVGGGFGLRRLEPSHNELEGIFLAATTPRTPTAEQSEGEQT
ncbi:MAG TPA: ABC transporter ATP-binding protein [Deltaproteobacteria bacterium]|nr:ABC transporter ATP-binding protein [Deltaproteobacteria bacterium]HCP48457.1 ABC transporter ATP-binding protein [Deltaproteobacteria bacterium]